MRVVRTNGNGAPSLQIFNTYGFLLFDVTMPAYVPFAMKKIHEDSLVVSFFPGGSNLEFFLPWFKSTQSMPNKLGHYNISYSYIVDTSYGLIKTKNVDWFVVDPKDKSVSLFYFNKLVDKIPIEKLIVSQDRLSYMEPGSNETIETNLIRPNVIERYLKDIVAMYRR